VKKLKIRNIKLTLEYDGTDFFGFQKQTNGVPTVQQAVEKALAELFRTETPLVSASSRTDAGVHAEDQIVHFKTSSDLPSFRIARALNHFLPSSVSVVNAEDVPDSFHARFQPISKVYEYRIWNDSSRPAIWRNFAHHEPVPLNIEKMKKAARFFLGKHDFRSFTSEDRIMKGRPSVSIDQVSFVRNVKRLNLQKRGKMLIFTIEADGFLYHMVRNIIGTIVGVGKDKINPRDVLRIIKARDRKQAAETLPAQGLTLKKVHYPANSKSRAKDPCRVM